MIDNARIAVIAPTSDALRTVCFEGESGFLACLPTWVQEKYYNKSRSEITLPNGAFIKGYTAQEPERLRGPQHHFGWFDEAAAARRRKEVWENFRFGLRLGDDPRALVTTTPKPVPLIKDLMKDKGCFVTNGTTYDNRKNLAQAFFDDIITIYEGTRVGREQLLGELLEDTPGALWTFKNIDENRIELANMPDLLRIVVAIDPAVSTNENSDETGIVVVGMSDADHGYVLSDISCKASPSGWGNKAINAFRINEADRVVGEVNNGGDMIESTLRNIDNNIPFRAVRASRGKMVRAEPIAALYEQNRVHHVGQFHELEDQMCQFTVDNIAEDSPDRVDALVWGFTDLFGGSLATGLIDFYRQQAQGLEDGSVTLTSGGHLIPTEQANSMKKRKDINGVGKVATSKLIKPAATEIDPTVCSNCGSRAIARIGGMRRCNQCGLEHNNKSTPPAMAKRSEY